MLFYNFKCPYRFADSFNGNQLSMPPGAAPAFIPSKEGAMYLSHGCCGPATFQIGQGLISTCVNQFVYIWPKSGSGYWSWINNITDMQYISGLRWTGSNWVNFRESFLNLQGYFCYNPFRTSEFW